VLLQQVIDPAEVLVAKNALLRDQGMRLDGRYQQPGRQPQNKQ
jgi:hypothetical protein